MTADPWALDRPTILSVSGGRTSMRMLWGYLDCHGGALPEHAVAVFCNTGKEHPKTLDFVQRCSVEWGVRIVWLEYQDAQAPADRWCEVNHNSASRDGEPFEAVIRRKGFLPNQVTRFCTTEMKVHCAHRWARAAWPHGRERYVKAIGFRADEPGRVTRARARCGHGKDPWDLCWPLFDAGIDEPEVMRWWRSQPFDLEIPQHMGNCDLCFLKSRAKLASIIEANPESADWWEEQESLMADTFRSRKSNYPSYASLRRWAMSEAPKPWKQGDLLEIECNCTD